MTGKEAVDYISGLIETRVKPGLERIDSALRILGSPHSSYTHVLIGGTNGKGSTIAFMASVLRESGLRTGVFTSPHMHRFEERIRVDGLPISGGEMEKLVHEVRSTCVDLSYFEFATAMALVHFAGADVDVALLEVGLGGRWDATNATDPIFSVITGVAMDHERLLGDTLGDVAREKAKILRPGKSGILGSMPDEALEVIREEACAVGAELLLDGCHFRLARDEESGSLVFSGGGWILDDIELGLEGIFQHNNAACAIAALELFSKSGFMISENAVRIGMRKAKWPGRYQVIPGNPELIVDAAHNPSAMRSLTASLKDDVHTVWLMSALNDKDMTRMAEEAACLSKEACLVQLSHPRASSLQNMRLAVSGTGLDVSTASSVAEGLELARKMAGRDGRVVVAGSVVLAAAVLDLAGLGDG